jgi:hypothetical protein
MIRSNREGDLARDEPARPVTEVCVEAEHPVLHLGWDGEQVGRVADMANVRDLGFTHKQEVEARSVGQIRRSSDAQYAAANLGGCRRQMGLGPLPRQADRRERVVDQRSHEEKASHGYRRERGTPTHPLSPGSHGLRSLPNLGE